MRKVVGFSAFLGVILFLTGCEVHVHRNDPGPGHAHAQVTYDDASVVVYREYFDCDADTVVFIRQTRFHHPSDVYALLYIAHVRNVDFRIIVDHYHKHPDLFKVAVNFGCKPDVFVVNVPGHVKVSGPPYGRAYGHYRKHKALDTLSHDEVRDLVELRVMVDYYGHDPEKAVRWKEGGKQFHDFAVEHHRDSGKGSNVKGGKVVKKDRPWEKGGKDHKSEDVKGPGKKSGDDKGQKPGKKDDDGKKPGKKEDATKKPDKKSDDTPKDKGSDKGDKGKDKGKEKGKKDKKKDKKED